MILGQRLLRVLCNDCKQSYTASPNEHKTITAIMEEHPYPTEVPPNLALYKPVGCQNCGNTGFKGRAGVFEGVLMDQAVEEVVVRDPREHAILEAAKPQKIPTMLQDGVTKVIAGDTSITELKRVVEFPRAVNFLDYDDLETANQDKTPKTHDISDERFAEHIV